MSTRWYPIYQRGNPQLRVFLPNFWMKLVRSEMPQPSNVVTFACSMEMTKYDVKNYLENIYKVPVMDVHTRIGLGKLKREPTKGYIIKDDDVKYAYVKLFKEEHFEFPTIFDKKKEQKEEDDKQLQEAKKVFHKTLERNKRRPSLPTWFSI